MKMPVYLKMQILTYGRYGKSVTLYCDAFPKIYQQLSHYFAPLKRANPFNKIFDIDLALLFSREYIEHFV